MAHHQERTPLQAAIMIRGLSIALLLTLCLAARTVFAKPVMNTQDALQLSQGEALAPKSTLDDAAGALSPAHEEARRLWNGAKKLRRMLQPKRYVRNVVNENVWTYNVSVPIYIQELYDNLTKSATGSDTQQRTTSANTVRSLEAVVDDSPNCELFKFNLSSINSSEYIVKAELHLYLERNDDTKNHIHVTIKPSESTDYPSWSLTTDIDLGNNNQQKYMFDVAAILAGWIRTGRKNASFVVEIFDDMASSSSDSPLPCNSIQFLHTSADENTRPHLVIHSYDPELEKIDYKKVMDSLNITDPNTVQRRSVQVRAGNSNQRRPRQTDTDFCRVYPLNITQNEIHNVIEETVVVPSFYDAGICGGGCEHTFPTFPDLRHNVLIHILKGTAEFTDRHGYNITRCCAPKKYAPLDAIVVDSNNRPYIRIIPNMVIEECECLEVIDFNSNPQPAK